MRGFASATLHDLLAILKVVIFGPLGMLLYFLLRPPDTLAELYERSLEEEALLQDLEERAVCPGCRRKIEFAWQVCPDCHTILKKTCLKCGRLLHLRWNICPYCVTPAAETVGQEDHHDEEEQQAPAAPTTLPENRCRSFPEGDAQTGGVLEASPV